MRHLNKVCAIVVSLFGAPVVLGQNLCNDISLNVGSGNVELTFCSANAGKVDVLLTTIPNGTEHIVKLEVANGTAIGRLTINHDTELQFPLTLGIIGVGPGGNPAGVEEILIVTNPTSGAPVFLSGLRINGDLGPVTGATRLVDVEITGSMTGPIDLVDRSWNAQNAAGQFNDILVQGDILANLSARITHPTLDKAHLLRFQVLGTLGTPLLPIDIVVEGNGDVDLECGEFNANFLGLPAITSLRVLDDLGETGDINQPISTFSGPAELIVDGAVKAPILIPSGFPDTLPGVEWQFAANGVQDQIIIGASSPFNKTWLGQATIGGVSLAGPNYMQTSAAIGTGAIGLVPFDLHDEDSFPVGGANETTSPSAISLKHYGPVSIFDLTVATGTPVTFDYRPKCSTDPLDWKPIDSGCFLARIPVGSDRELEVIPGFTLPNGFAYRIQPITSGDVQLQSELGANDAPVANYEYSFTMGGNCPEDIDGDGTVGSSDLNTLLFLFGQSFSCPKGGDVTQDGKVDLADLQRVLFAFGTDCSCSASAMAGGGGGGATALIAEACGFNHSEAYLAWRASLSPAELANHLKDIPAILAGR